MTTAHRFFSLSLLGGMLLATSPLASAQGFSGRGHEGPLADVDQETRQEIRAKLDDCRESNEDREDAKACADGVFSSYSIEKPEYKMGGRRGKRMGKKFHSAITETCGERENSDTWRTCAKETRGTERSEFKENHPRADKGSRGLRGELVACLQLDSDTELIACVLEVRAKIRAQADAE